MDLQEDADECPERMHLQVDADRPETMINDYANTMNMLLGCIKGLGVLIVTWTTVVLLGGFVSLLEKEDFWCLTAITLVQLAGAFNIFLSKTIKAVWASYSKLVKNDIRRMKNPFKELFDGNDIPLAWKVILFILVGICMVFSLIIGVAFLVIILIILSPIIVPIIVILSPIIAIYIFGMCISTVISVMRLSENDYGNADDGANFKPALIVLYSLAVLQGVVFGLTGLYYCAMRKKVVKQVEDAYNISQSNLVSNYLRETVAGCQKDRAFLEGRNLVTYAVDQLLKPVRPEIYVSGLSSIISAPQRTESILTERQISAPQRTESILTERQKVLVRVRSKQLLVESLSCSHIIHKLLRILHPKSQYSTGTKEDAARIVAFLADEINLEEFPRGIQCISTLLDTFEVQEYPPLLMEAMCNRGQQVVLPDEAAETLDNLIQIEAYKNLVLQGLCILAGLADSEDNCRVIGNTAYLLSRITAPLVSIRLHKEHHDVWSSSRIAEQSLILMCKLMAAPGGETADKLRCHISSDGNTTIVSTLQSILQCTECEGKAVQLVAMEILLYLSSVDTGSIIMASGSGSCRPFIMILLRVFLQIYSTELLHRMCTSMHWMKKRSYMRNLAGNMLASLSSQSETIATAILRVCVSSSVLGNLVNTFVNARDNTYRMRAAEILEYLCVGYTEDDEHLKKLKIALLDAMPKVLRELLSYGTTREGIQAETGNITSYSAQGSDLEQGRPLHDNRRRNKYSSCWENSEQHGHGAPKEALLSLCVMVGYKFIMTDPDQAPRFDQIASKICSELGIPIKSFGSLMEEAKEILTKDNAKQFATAADKFSSGS